MKKILFVTGIAILMVSCKQRLDEIDGSAGVINNSTLVEIQDVPVSSNTLPIFAIGKVASDEEIKLSFKIGGIISRVRVDEGDYVRKGDLLATLRSNEIDAQVTKAQQSLEKAKRDLGRTQKMYEEGAATLENIQDLSTLVEVSEADLQVAVFNQ